MHSAGPMLVSYDIGHTLISVKNFVNNTEKSVASLVRMLYICYSSGGNC